jgi:FKBP-type peptidyl-prolyl cis-trans isomerase SlyD
METKKNKFISVSYKLYAIDGDKKELVEETSNDRPFQFITGFGVALDGFEMAVEVLEQGADFNFELPKELAFGEYDEKRVISLDKSIFEVDGKFDKEVVFKGARVPLQNEDGNYFVGVVLDITSDKVRIDLNSPLAGKTLNFVGKVIENREATKEEMQALVSQMSGHGCSGGCEGCGGGCGHHDEGESCGCGHCKH